MPQVLETARDSASGFSLLPKFWHTESASQDLPERRPRTPTKRHYRCATASQVTKASRKMPRSRQSTLVEAAVSA